MFNSGVKWMFHPMLFFTAANVIILIRFLDLLEG